MLPVSRFWFLYTPRVFLSCLRIQSLYIYMTSRGGLETHPLSLASQKQTTKTCPP